MQRLGVVLFSFVTVTFLMAESASACKFFDHMLGRCAPLRQVLSVRTL